MAGEETPLTIADLHDDLLARIFEHVQQRNGEGDVEQELAGVADHARNGCHSLSTICNRLKPL